MIKEKKVYLLNQLKEKGAEIDNLKEKIDSLENLIESEKGFGTRSIMSRKQRDFLLVLTDFDLKQCTSRYVWENLPDYLSSKQLELMLYYRGSLVGFKYNETLLILPYVVEGNLNPYGNFTKVRPLYFNTDVTRKDFFEKKLTLNVVNNDLKVNEDYDGVLLFDGSPYLNSDSSCISRFILNRKILSEMSDILARIPNNILISDKKIIIQVSDESQARIINKSLNKAFDNESPFIIVSSPFETQTIQNSNDFNTDELFNALKNFDNLRCRVSGIHSESYGQEKKERMITGELQGNEEQSDFVLDDGLEYRLDFCKRFNKAFNTDLKVSKRCDLNKDNEEKGDEDNESMDFSI